MFYVDDNYVWLFVLCKSLKAIFYGVFLLAGQEKFEMNIYLEHRNTEN